MGTQGWNNFVSASVQDHRVMVTQWLKCRPTDLVVPGSSPAQGEILSTVNGVPFHTAFHNHLHIILIWLKYCLKRCKITSHPSISSTSQLIKCFFNFVCPLRLLSLWSSSYWKTSFISLKILYLNIIINEILVSILGQCHKKRCCTECMKREH